MRRVGYRVSDRVQLREMLRGDRGYHSAASAGGGVEFSVQGPVRFGDELPVSSEFILRDYGWRGPQLAEVLLNPNYKP